MDSLIILYCIAVLALGCAVFLAVSGVRCGGRNLPIPPEHLRSKKKGVPKMRNPPIPPVKNQDSICYRNCGDTLPSFRGNSICLNCGSSIVMPEFPKDRT